MSSYEKILISKNELINYIEKLGQTVGLDTDDLLLTLHEVENILHVKKSTEKAYDTIEKGIQKEDEEHGDSDA